MNVLVFNPGSNSLKAEVVRCDPSQRSASQSVKLIDIIVEGIGASGKLSRYKGKEIDQTELIEAPDYHTAAIDILHWLEQQDNLPALDSLDCVGIRVVHGGPRFTEPAALTAEVEREILELAKWAPLHNRRSVEILPAIRERLPRKPVFAVFDTAFHHTIPDRAATYAIPFDLSQKHQVRRYGFHGISHRYLLERYAHLIDRDPREVTVVSMHLESGCSVTAVSKGQSVDNTMGLTPLEGLMMGTRSGDVDPALIPFLAAAENISVDEVMTLLNKKSGLLGVSGKSLDTRVLMKDYATDPRVQLAMEIFSYRVLKAIGGYLCALGGADAILFGGGIAENTLLVRERICASLRWCGLEVDRAQNQELINIEGRLSTAASPIQAWVIPVEEGLQIAHECCRTLSQHGRS